MREQDSQYVSLDVGFRVVGLVTGSLSWRTEAGVPDGDPFPDKKTSAGHGFLGFLHPPFPPAPHFIPSQLTAQKHRNLKDGVWHTWWSPPLCGLHLDPEADELCGSWVSRILGRPAKATRGSGYCGLLEESPWEFWTIF